MKVSEGSLNKTLITLAKELVFINDTYNNDIGMYLLSQHNKETEQTKNGVSKGNVIDNSVSKAMENNKDHHISGDTTPQKKLRGRPKSISTTQTIVKNGDKSISPSEGKKNLNNSDNLSDISCVTVSVKSTSKEINVMPMTPPSKPKDAIEIDSNSDCMTLDIATS